MCDLPLEWPTTNDSAVCQRARSRGGSHLLHENPELKRGAFAWLTDFIGWLAMPDTDPNEARLTSDYNAEMIGHIDRYHWVCAGPSSSANPDNIAPGAFGPDLRSLPDWTEAHFDFSGHITGFTQNGFDELRDEVGFPPDEFVCIATVGGSRAASRNVPVGWDICL